MEIRTATAYRESWIVPAAYKAASHNRMDASNVDLGAILTSGTPRATQLVLPHGFVFTKIGWVSGATALVTGTMQVAYLLDSTLKIIAASADRTNTSWAANTVKDFTFSSTTLRRPQGTYYATLVVAATTTPSLKGVLDSDAVIAALAPILGGNSATTGLTAPSAVGTVFGAITASGAKPLVMIG